MKVIKENEIGSLKVANVTYRKTLNFTDIINNNNKYYNLEVQDTDKGWYIYTIYGRVGGTSAKEYRACSSQSEAETESDKIIKSKTKKGYVEVKLLKADIGSEVGKSKVEASVVTVEGAKKAGIKVEEDPVVTSKLHPEVQDLVRTWFGVTQEFIELNLDTKKCPLGQLSLDQISKGKDLLEEARKIIHLAKPDINELNRITNQYYSNIPHNFGYARIDANYLRFDDDNKIDKAFDILDVLNDGKNIQTVISRKSNVDAQYATLNADLEWVDPQDPTFKWIDAMIHGTRASNHSFLGKLKTHKVFKVNRKNERDHFLSNAERIAKECGKHNPSDIYAKFVYSRPDVPKELQDLYKNANVCPGWHGTRRANMIGITTKGLLIRPSGVVHAGSMYGDAVYISHQSSKSINYVDVRGSYWAQGQNKTGYLFLLDAALGNQKIASGSYMYTRNNIKPYHSVWAVGGKSGVINDEVMLYNQTGKDQQHQIKYIIEFETQAK